MAEGWLYDGRSAVRRDVQLGAEDGLLAIQSGSEIDRLAPADLFHLESRRDAELYGRAGEAGWRLGVAKPIPSEIAALLPRKQVYGRWIDRVGLPKALAIGAVVSAAVLFIGNRAPAWIAPVVPYSWEQSFGDALVGDFGQNFCSNEDAQQALDAMTAKLAPDPGKYKVRVVDLPLVNAVALPGGHVVLFQGLLEEAKSPDEVAGVLGHEIAHVENRHATEAMIRHYGVSVLLSSLGGSTGGNVDMLTSASYSREAESEADGDSIAALRRANISPLPTAAFFERLARLEVKIGPFDETLGYLSSHPLSRSRQQRFAKSAVPDHRYEPSLTDSQWKALRGICEGAPND